MWPRLVGWRRLLFIVGRVPVLLDHMGSSSRFLMADSASPFHRYP